MPGFNYGGSSVGDGTNWSSERGSDPTTPGGGDNGHSGDHSSSGNSSSNVEHTPWGDVTTDAAGFAYMNGVKMTGENSQLAYASPTHLVRVLNSVLDRSFMKPEPGEHSGVSGVPATTPTLLTVASNAVTAAQAKAAAAADSVTKADKAVSQAQTRLSNATAAIPHLQAEITRTQKVFDDAYAKVSSMAAFAHAAPISNQFRAWQQAGYEAQKAQNSLNSAKTALSNGQAEIIAAQKALEDAKKALPVAASNKQQADAAVVSAIDMKEAITTATAFFESTSKKFGERAARLAQELAAQAHSAKIRSVPEAIALFDKYKGTAVNKLNAADKAAIANAFKSLDHAEMAKQLTAYSKVFGRFNKAMDFADLGAAVGKGIETGNWNDAITKLESIALSNTAGQLVAIAFATAGAPLGIVGFGIVMMLSGVIFSNENVLKAINTSLGM
jgi:predicted  nucleic acid-binding Zn-ribbon protein